MSYHEISSSQTFVCSKTEKIAIIYGGNKQSPCEWYRNNKVACQDMLLEHGGVLLRGFDISSTSEFNRFANNFSSELMNYTYRSSPRTCVGGKIYTSTEYPADRSIPLHNENS